MLAALERARATSLGKDPDAFERAVCALFETLGFVATHVGGNAAPDGFVDAPLGPLAYRALLECKTGQSNVIVSQLNVAEAAKYRDRYEADYCLLVGPGFAPRTTFASELQIHGVSAWTIDDLAAVFHAGFDPNRLRPLFGPGLVADVVEDAVWDAAHGEAKCIAAICEILESIAARQQRVALAAPPSEAPHLDVDAATLILDEHFSAGNSPARCTRADVEAASHGSAIPASAAPAGPTPNTNRSSSQPRSCPPEFFEGWSTLTLVPLGNARVTIPALPGNPPRTKRLEAARPETHHVRATALGLPREADVARSK
ncbi:MAG: hypothetical protein JO036_11425 [Candidatus Eremiobacteraeota bacterium]|nr:hypothetical protein [Candidatus Eremiobacteraeota bacterium]